MTGQQLGFVPGIGGRGGGVIPPQLQPELDESSEVSSSGLMPNSDS